MLSCSIRECSKQAIIIWQKLYIKACTKQNPKSSPDQTEI